MNLFIFVLILVSTAANSWGLYVAMTGRTNVWFGVAHFLLLLMCMALLGTKSGEMSGEQS